MGFNLSKYTLLKKDFYSQDTLSLSKNLLGKILVHRDGSILYAGRIVETEAYLINDSASHAFKGKTRRNTAMFGPPGRSYIYLIYGMYHCFNIVSNKENIGEAVLIRALEPLSGIEAMRKNRQKKNKKILKDVELCNGPGKLVIAMGMRADQNEACLVESELQVYDAGEKIKKKDIVVTTRIGIRESTPLPYRFYIKNNSFVSVL